MNGIISKTERAYLVSASVVIAILSVVNIVTAVVTPILYPPPFVIYDMSRASLFPLFRLLIIFVPLFLFWGKRFFIPLTYTLVALLPAYLEFFRDYQALIADFESYETYNSIRILLMIANPLDYTTFVLSNMILIWLATIVIRSFTVSTGEIKG